MTHKKPKTIAYLLTLILVFTQVFSTNLGSITTQAATTRMANVVLFVDFADTDHSDHDKYLVGECYLKDPATTIELFDGNDSVNTGMKQYLDTISYGQLELVNIFPQYDTESNTITPYTVPGKASEYAGGTASVLLSEVLTQLEASNTLTEDADLNDDGIVDNITLVVAYTDTDSEGNDIFVSHKSSIGGIMTLGDLQVNDYNLVTESGAYLGLQQSGLLIHEFMHTLGYPDLYKVGATSDSTATPVGGWDIMASNTYRLQYPLAYLRSEYTGWFTIPTITEDVTGYTIYSATAATDATKNNQALILKTDYSDTEFFVVEYRHTDSIDYSTIYDNYVYGSGLIVYRVNTKQEKNIAGQTDHIYVFRPGDSYDDNGHEAGDGDLTKSFLSAESTRTSYGSSDYEATLSDGAITYSDGTNSGIVISNVGSASGDTISFDVTFGDGGESIGGFWNTETTKSISDLSNIDSCMDAEGNIYVVAGLSTSTASASKGSFQVYKYSQAGTWTQLGDAVSVNGNYHKFLMVDNQLYVACSDYDNYKINLYKYNNGWTKVFTSTYSGDEFDAVVDNGKVYIAYNSPYSYGTTSSMYCESYSASGTTSYGVAHTGSYLCNPCISVYNGAPVIVTRDVFGGNVIQARKYSATSGQWSSIGGSLTADNFHSKVFGDTLYLMKNGDGNGDYESSYVYSLNLTSTSSTWSQQGTNAFIDDSAVPMSMFFYDGAIYITYQNGASESQDVYVKTLVNNKWKAVGTKVTRDGIISLGGHIYEDTIYLVYGNRTSGITIKTHEYAEDADQVGGDSGNTGTGNSGNSGSNSNTGTGNSGNSGSNSNTGTGNSGSTGTTTETTFVAPNINVSYRTHVQDIGWQEWKSNGTMSGTSGRSKRLEGINISVSSATVCKDLDLGIQYTTHCQDYGWLPWSADGDMNGTEGESKRLEAIKIQLTGDHAKLYDVYYRVHAQDYGWLGWASNGAPAGTAGYSKRLEGIQIVVVKKGASINQTMGNITSARSEAFVPKAGSSPIVNYPATSNTNPVVPGADIVNVAYRTHVQDYGWQNWKYNGQMSGTSGQSKRLEGINIELRNKDCDGGIVYTTHVQDYGWQGNINDQSTWRKNGEMSGTSGESKRLEAICINLTGEMAENYDIYYRVHAQDYGWLSWAKNGAPAGTAGYSKRLEGIQIVLVRKGQAAPGNEHGIVSNNSNSYISR